VRVENWRKEEPVNRNKTCLFENDFKDSLEQISFHCPATACGNEESQR
jgi:hypothetical protein